VAIAARVVQARGLERIAIVDLTSTTAMAPPLRWN
jgi:hypothetical protein